MKKNYTILIIFSLFTFLIYFSRLNWGTPSWEKTLQIFTTKEKLVKYTPQIVELRNKYYAKRWEIFDNKDEITLENVKQRMIQTWGHWRKTNYFDIISEDVILDFSRAYIFSVRCSDEGQAVYPLANINPKKFDFDPDTYIYGGFYYFVVGSFLIVGKILGLVNITSNIAYYFVHPEETTKIYMIVRSIGSISVLLSVIILFYLIQSLYSYRVAIFSSIFLIMSPIVLSMTSLAKPHGLSMFLLLCGLWFIKQIFEDENNENKKNWLFGSIFLGLGAATLIVNISFVAVLIFTAYFVTNKNLSMKDKLFSMIKNKNFIGSLGIFFLVYFIFNYYIILHPDRFLRFVLHQKIYSGYSVVQISEIIKFFWKIFVDGTHWSIVPLFLVGIIFIFKDKRPFVKVLSIFSVVYFLINIFFFRHPGVWTISYPLFSIIIAVGTEFLLSKRSIKIIVSIYVIFTLAVLTTKTFYHTTLLSKESYLTSVGAWINDNIPSGSTIGVPGVWMLPADYPPFDFFKYKLINFPLMPSSEDFSRKVLPQYLIINSSNLQITRVPGFEKRYQLLKEWQLPKFLNFSVGYLASGTSVLKIYCLQK